MEEVLEEPADDSDGDKADKLPKPVAVEEGQNYGKANTEVQYYYMIHNIIWICAIVHRNLKSSSHTLLKIQLIYQFKETSNNL